MAAKYMQINYGQWFVCSVNDVDNDSSPVSYQKLRPSILQLRLFAWPLDRRFLADLSSPAITMMNRLSESIGMIPGSISRTWLTSSGATRSLHRNGDRGLLCVAISEIGASRVLKRGASCSNERLFQPLSCMSLISAASISKISGFFFAVGQYRHRWKCSRGMTRVTIEVRRSDRIPIEL